MYISVSTRLSRLRIYLMSRSKGKILIHTETDHVRAQRLREKTGSLLAIYSELPGISRHSEASD